MVRHGVGDAAAAAAHPVGMVFGPGGALHAVVIGNDPRVRRALAGLLVAGGRVRVAEELETGRDAAAALARACPDLVLIDLESDDTESGLGVVGGIRSRCPSSIMVVLGSTDALAPRIVAAGADAFCSKLASPRSLCDVVDATLGKRTVTRARE